MVPFVRSCYSLAVLSFVVPSVSGQNAPTEALRQWARQHVHPVSSVEGDARGDADLRSLRVMIGDARVVAFGEPFHGGHEPLAMRNRLIRYAVTQLGFRAIALETGVTSSKVLYDYVVGRTTETEAVVGKSLSYDFGDFQENVELIGWLRNYNATQSPKRQVHLYGIDLEGNFFPYAYRSVDTVLKYLELAAPGIGADLARQYGEVIRVFRSDEYVKLSPSEKDAISGRIQDLVTLVRRERIPLTAATSLDEYDWALRQATAADQDDAYLRALPSSSDWELLKKSPEKLQPAERWDHIDEMREQGMADNLLWVRQREMSRGRILLFAHNDHVQTVKPAWGAPGQPSKYPDRNYQVMGAYLKAAIPDDLFVIGTRYRHGSSMWKGETPPPLNADITGDLLSSLAIPQFLMNLHELPKEGALRDWFETPHETWGDGETPQMLAPLGPYDAIFFIDTITPARASGK